MQSAKESSGSQTRTLESTHVRPTISRLEPIMIRQAPPLLTCSAGVPDAKPGMEVSPLHEGIAGFAANSVSLVPACIEKGSSQT